MILRVIATLLIILGSVDGYINYNNPRPNIHRRQISNNKNNLPYSKPDLNHLDNENIKNLEKLFYLRNNKYSPFRNIIYSRYIRNNVNITDVFSSLDNSTDIIISNEQKDNIVRLFEDVFNNTEIKVNQIDDSNEEAIERIQNYTNNQPGGKIILRPIGPIIDSDEESDIFNNFKKTIQYRQRKSGFPGTETDDHNFEIIKDSKYNFTHIGGYDNIKDELYQVVDILVNREKYSKFNVRVPRGLIFEGPPGNGKTLLAKGFCGEANMSFIPVSGSEFTEKYVGVGASRIRDLFKIAKENSPCIIFIDEIDALARKRGSDMVNSNSEKDQTLNQLLINLDGFENNNEIFVMGSTNRIDLLDNALIRPGRMDKKVYIGLPDSNTRSEIIKIHLKGKPLNKFVDIESITELTGGYSGAQIENLLNEAMLYAIRKDREMMEWSDLEYINNRILAGWQDKESKFSEEMIDRIIVHELGHALVGFLAKDHSNVMKVVLNMWSPTSPGYTVFENNDEDSNIYTKDSLTSRLMVLLAGRIAEEIFFGYSVTSGAKQDLEQAYEISKTMILNYGMGEKNIYPDLSDRSKYLIDQEISRILMEANEMAYKIIDDNKHIIKSLVNKLKNTKLLTPDDIYDIINSQEETNQYMITNNQYYRMFRDKVSLILDASNKL